jgi:hypothetical protein
VVEEVEHGVIGPMQVLDHQHRRALLGEHFEEPPPGRERLGPTIPAELDGAGQADQRPEVTADPASLPLVRNQRANCSMQLGGGLLRRVGVDDAGLCLHDLAEGPQGHAVPVGQAAPLPPGGQRRFGLDLPAEFHDQPSLADPRHSHQRHQLRRLLVPRSGLGVEQ